MDHLFNNLSNNLSKNSFNNLFNFRVDEEKFKYDDDDK